jgi:hypothetical protein
LIFCLIFGYGCTKKQKIKETYAEWIDKQIVMPDSIKPYSFAEEVSKEYANTCKIFLYVNDKECVRCWLKLPNWKILLSDIHKLTNSDVEMLICAQPKDKDVLEKIMKEERFYVPIYFDYNGVVNGINHFDNNTHFHCFLLDENNHVILIGNPVQNPKIRDLYIRTICERLGIKPELNTVSKPLNQRKSLGTFNWQTAQNATFTIHNTSSEPMLIDTLYTSCECTTAEIDKRRVEPTDSAFVSIRFKSEKPEQFLREVYVGVQGKETIVLSIEGEAME